MTINYQATADKAFAIVAAMDAWDRSGRKGQAMSLHAANFRDVALGHMVDTGDDDIFMRQTEWFFRAHGLLVEDVA